MNIQCNNIAVSTNTLGDTRMTVKCEGVRHDFVLQEIIDQKGVEFVLQAIGNEKAIAEFMQANGYIFYQSVQAA